VSEPPAPDPSAPGPGLPGPAAPGPSPSAPPAAAGDEGPALARTPGWVPAAVVAGAVLLVEGFIVSQIRADASEGSPAFVADLATVSFLLGALSLVAGYSAFLLARVPAAKSIEALVLTAVAVFAYGWSWNVALTSLNGEAASLAGIRDAGLTGKGAAFGAIAMWFLSATAFAFSFKWWTGIVWPHFRGWVALNVLAMVHIVVFLLGVVSWLNVNYTPRPKWTTLDLTGTGQFSLGEKTRAVLGKVDGELLVFYMDNGGDRRNRSSFGTRTQDLLRQFQGACPRMSLRVIEGLRSSPDDVRKPFTEAGMESLLDGISGEEDVVVLGYRPPGEKLVARTKLVEVNQEFGDTSALGNEKFRGEGILTNAVNEVVFAQRRLLFIEGHGELPSAGGEAPNRCVSQMAEAFRGDNFAVGTHDLVREPRIPDGTDAVCIAGPRAPFAGAEVEALKEYLGKGGALILLLDLPPNLEPPGPSGLEDLLDSWGIAPRRDVIVISWFVERTVLKGNQSAATAEVYASKDELGRHPLLEALRSTSLVLGFRAACPVFKAEKPPEGVGVQELVYAPREVGGLKPFGAILRKGRDYSHPLPGDIVDKRLPVAVAAERKAGGTEKGGGRIVVFGDADFATDLRLETSRETSTPANRTLIVNAVSWAVRRDLIAVDPKTVETEIVQLRPIDRDLAFWSMVVALPVLALGLAVGVWWSRRR